MVMRHRAPSGFGQRMKPRRTSGGAYSDSSSDEEASTGGGGGGPSDDPVAKKRAQRVTYARELQRRTSCTSIASGQVGRVGGRRNSLASASPALSQHLSGSESASPASKHDDPANSKAKQLDDRYGLTSTAESPEGAGIARFKFGAAPDPGELGSGSSAHGSPTVFVPGFKFGSDEKQPSFGRGPDSDGDVRSANTPQETCRQEGQPEKYPEFRFGAPEPKSPAAAGKAFDHHVENFNFKSEGVTEGTQGSSSHGSAGGGGRVRGNSNSPATPADPQPGDPGDMEETSGPATPAEEPATSPNHRSGRAGSEKSARSSAPTEVSCATEVDRASDAADSSGRADTESGGPCTPADSGPPTPVSRASPRGSGEKSAASLDSPRPSSPPAAARVGKGASSAASHASARSGASAGPPPQHPGTRRSSSLGPAEGPESPVGALHNFPSGGTSLMPAQSSGFGRETTVAMTLTGGALPLVTAAQQELFGSGGSAAAPPPGAGDASREAALERLSRDCVEQKYPALAPRVRHLVIRKGDGKVGVRMHGWHISGVKPGMAGDQGGMREKEKLLAINGELTKDDTDAIGMALSAAPQLFVVACAPPDATPEAAAEPERGARGQAASPPSRMAPGASVVSAEPRASPDTPQQAPLASNGSTLNIGGRRKSSLSPPPLPPDRPAQRSLPADAVRCRVASVVAMYAEGRDIPVEVGRVLQQAGAEDPVALACQEFCPLKERAWVDGDTELVKHMVVSFLRRYDPVIDGDYHHRAEALIDEQLRRMSSSPGPSPRGRRYAAARDALLRRLCQEYKVDFSEWTGAYPQALRDIHQRHRRKHSRLESLAALPAERRARAAALLLRRSNTGRNYRRWLSFAVQSAAKRAARALPRMPSPKGPLSASATARRSEAERLLGAVDPDLKCALTVTAALIAAPGSPAGSPHGRQSPVWWQSGGAAATPDDDFSWEAVSREGDSDGGLMPLPPLPPAPTVSDARRSGADEKLRSKLKRAEAERDRLDARVSELEARLRSKEDENERLIGSTARALNQAQSLEQSSSVRPSAADIAALRPQSAAELEQLKQRLEAARRSLETSETDREGLRRELQETKQAHEHDRRERDDLREQLVALKKGMTHQQSMAKLQAQRIRHRASLHEDDDRSPHKQEEDKEVENWQLKERNNELTKELKDKNAVLAVAHDALSRLGVSAEQLQSGNLPEELVASCHARLQFLSDRSKVAVIGSAGGPGPVLDSSWRPGGHNPRRARRRPQQASDNVASPIFECSEDSEEGT